MTYSRKLPISTECSVCSADACDKDGEVSAESYDFCRTVQPSVFRDADVDNDATHVEVRQCVSCITRVRN